MNPTCNDTLHDEIAPYLADVTRNMRKIETAVRDCLPDPRSVRIRSGKILVNTIGRAWHPRLVEILAWLDETNPGRIVITSGWRNGDGIHGTDPLRALDLSSYEFPNPVLIETHVNHNWDYGKEPYTVCKYHRVADCRQCGHRLELRPEVGLTVAEFPGCPKCAASFGHLVDFGPHFHVQARNESKRITA